MLDTHKISFSYIVAAMLFIYPLSTFCPLSFFAPAALATFAGSPSRERSPLLLLSRRALLPSVLTLGRSTEWQRFFDCPPFDFPSFIDCVVSAAACKMPAAAAAASMLAAASFDDRLNTPPAKQVHVSICPDLSVRHDDMYL